MREAMAMTLTYLQLLHPVLTFGRLALLALTVRMLSPGPDILSDLVRGPPLSSASPLAPRSTPDCGIPTDCDSI
jgi:hypothetical protein